MKFFSEIPLLLFFVVIATGCKRSGCTDPAALNFDPDAKKDCCCTYPDTFALEVRFDFSVNGNPFSLLTDFADSSGRLYNFSLVKFYLGNFKVEYTGGEFEIEDSYLLVDPGLNKYYVGSLPAGSYSKVTFNIGIDSVTNSTKQPADFSPSHPLGPQSPSMYWAWNTGYIFLKAEGFIDTNQIPDAVVDWPYGFHLGTNDLLRSCEINYTFSGAAGQTVVLDIVADLGLLFNNIDLRTENATHTLNNLPLAKKMMDNTPFVFSKK